MLTASTQLYRPPRTNNPSDPLPPFLIRLFTPNRSQNPLDLQICNLPNPLAVSNIFRKFFENFEKTGQKAFG